jgi:NADPH2:quinone reductase
MTETMTAWVAQGGKPDEEAFLAVEGAAPELGPGDLLVRVRAVSVNPVDTKVRARLPAGSNRQLGYDAAGTVEAVGSAVKNFSVGDEVWYAGDIRRDGTNAQLHAVDERIVSLKPASTTWAEAAAMPLTTITAWESLFDHIGLEEDSSGVLLILGGAGGVGSVMIQLAKALTEVTVIATASRPESREWALSLGADHVIGRDDIGTQVRQIAPHGARWAFSPYTRGNIDTFTLVVQPFGHVVAIDEPDGLDILPLRGKSISFHWENMFARIVHNFDAEHQGKLLARTAELIDTRRIRSTLHTTIDTLDPDGLQRAHQLVKSGRAVGKIVLCV